ncbi:MAG: outer membrane protein assembly factor BamB family protein [Thermoguttaceae bacterium]
MILPGLVAVAGILSLGIWVWGTPAPELELRQPKPEESEGPPVALSGGPAAGALIPGEGKPSGLPGAWPGFRGPNRDGIAEPGVRLARFWPPAGPKVLWSVELGEGYAGAAVQDGRVYVFDYDHAKGHDALRCLSLADGKEIWRYSYPMAVPRNHGMSRTVPAVAGGRVVGLGPRCHVVCLDASSGKLQWFIDLVRQYGTTEPDWYAGQCPLVDRGRVILAPGGPDALLLAVDLASGKPVWKTPNPRRWQMTHSSIMPMEFKGRRMYVYCASGGVVGVSAEDGAILWETTEWRVRIATVPSPVCLPDGRIFLCGGYNAGAMMLQLDERAGAWTAQVRLRLKPDQFGSTQHTPLLYGGHLYGVREKDKMLVCLGLDGKPLWHSGPAERFGSGPYLIADGLIYLMSDDGVLTMAEATPRRFTQLAQARVLSGHEAWGPMALAGSRLLVRDETRMVCLDIGKP